MKTASPEAVEPAYGWTVRLPGRSMEQARAVVTEALAEEGFGILTEIDVAATLKKKLDRDFRPYVILGACNPHLAHRALEAELPIGLLLPCNVCLWKDGEATVVAIARPDAMFQVAGAEALRPVADEAELRLRAVLAKLA
jgi:uncharacterized protein (DUF302 family)